jgi:hypothetical protein
MCFLTSDPVMIFPIERRRFDIGAKRRARRAASRPSTGNHNLRDHSGQSKPEGQKHELCQYDRVLSHVPLLWTYWLVDLDAGWVHPSSKKL